MYPCYHNRHERMSMLFPSSMGPLGSHSCSDVPYAAADIFHLGVMSHSAVMPKHWCRSPLSMLHGSKPACHCAPGRTALELYASLHPGARCIAGEPCPALVWAQPTLHHAALLQAGAVRPPALLRCYGESQGRATATIAAGR